MAAWSISDANSCFCQYVVARKLIWLEDVIIAMFSIYITQNYKDATIGPSQSANTSRWVSRILMHSNKLNAFAFRVASKCKRHKILHGSWNRWICRHCWRIRWQATVVTLFVKLAQDISQALCSMFTLLNKWGQTICWMGRKINPFSVFS